MNVIYFLGVKLLKEESQLLDRILYKNHNRFRNDRGYKAIQILQKSGTVIKFSMVVFEWGYLFWINAYHLGNLLFFYFPLIAENSPNTFKTFNWEVLLLQLRSK